MKSESDAARHPTVAALAEAPRSPAVAAHLAACAACRQLVALLSPEGPPTVERGHYADWEALHAGGMGRIFRARDRRLDRVVAVKVLHAGAVERPELRARFEAEARLVARLDHPAIVAIHEAGRFEDGEPFFAMRLVNGRPLDRALAETPTLAGRLTLLPHLAVVAEAVAYAHGQGIVHRDLKPHNVLVGSFGETVVVDWGVARDLRTPAPEAVLPAGADAGLLTRLGVGTPQYMPPEQAAGAPADPRMDVYALGATLYHLLAGAPPYGDDTGVRALLLAGPPPPLTDAPPELAAVAERAMARDPAARYATALELAQELRRYLEGRPTRAHRYTAGEILRRWAWRHRVALTVAAAAVAALAGVVVWSATRVVAARDEARDSAAVARAALADARGALASRLAADAATRLEALALGADAVGQALADGGAPSPQAVAGLYDALAAGPAIAPLAGHRGRLLLYDRGGDVFATVGEDAVVRLWDARTGALRASAGTGVDRPTLLRLAPDGGRLLVGGVDPRVAVCAVDGAAIGCAPVAVGGAVVAGLAWLDGGRRWAGADLAGACAAFDAEEDREIARVSCGEGVRGIAAGAEGVVAVDGRDGGVRLWWPATGRLQAARGASSIAQVAFTPDGRTLLLGGFDGTLWRAAVDGPATRLPGAARGNVNALHASPASDGVLVAADDQFLVRLPDGPAVPVRVGLWTGSPYDGGGRRFVGAGCELFDAATGARLATLRAPPDTLPACYLTADGDRAVAITGGEAAYLVDARLAVESGTLPRLSGEVLALRATDAGLVAVSLGGEVRWFALDGAPPVARRPTGRTTVAWDVAADGSVVLADEAGEVVRARPDGGVERLAAPGGAPPVAVLASGRIVGDGATAAAEARGRFATGDARGRVAVEGGASFAAPDGRPIQALVFIDDLLAVAGAGGPTRLHDPRDGAVRAVRDGTPVGPPGDPLVTATPDGRVFGPDGAPAGSHHAAVVAAALSADGALLATAALDGSVRVWSLGEGRARFVVQPRDVAPPTAVVFAGGELVVGHADGALRAYPIGLSAALDRACARLRAFGRAPPPGIPAPACAGASRAGP